MKGEKTFLTNGLESQYNCVDWGFQVAWLLLGKAPSGM